VRTIGLVLAILVASARSVLGIEGDWPLVGCPQALAVGTLKLIPPDQLALQTDEDEVVEIGWSADLAVRPGPPAELVDSSGQVVARAGDRVSITGGYLDGRTFTEWDGVRVMQPAS
jgi:hypothetical protein